MGKPNFSDEFKRDAVAKYLAVVIDLYSRRVVGWSMQSRQTTDVVLQALHMAVQRRDCTRGGGGSAYRKPGSHHPA